MLFRKLLCAILATVMILSLCACGTQPEETTPTEPNLSTEPATPQEITVTDMIGREVTIIAGSY